MDAALAGYRPIMRTRGPLTLAVLPVAVLTTLALASGAQGAGRTWQDCGRAATTQAGTAAGLPARLDADPGLQRVFGDEKPSQTYTKAQRALCADFDGDGDLDRAGLYTCCTVSSPSPLAILRNDGAGRWAIAYARLGDPVFKLRGSGSRLVTTTPKYASSDPNCCPSRLTERRIRWTGDHFTSSVRVRRAPQR